MADVFQPTVFQNESGAVGLKVFQVAAASTSASTGTTTGGRLIDLWTVRM